MSVFVQIRAPPHLLGPHTHTHTHTHRRPGRLGVQRMTSLVHQCSIIALSFLSRRVQAAEQTLQDADFSVPRLALSSNNGIVIFSSCRLLLCLDLWTTPSPGFCISIGVPRLSIVIITSKSLRESEREREREREREGASSYYSLSLSSLVSLECLSTHMCGRRPMCVFFFANRHSAEVLPSRI